MADDRTEAPAHYAERSGEQESPQSGDGARFSREDSPTGQSPGADAGGRAHTSPSEGHPAGEGARSDRDVGGPRAEEDAEDATGRPGAHGDRPTEGMEPHT